MQSILRKKSAKFILPPTGIALIVLLVYLLYEPSTQFDSTPTKTISQDKEYKYEIILKNAKEDTKEGIKEEKNCEEQLRMNYNSFERKNI